MGERSTSEEKESKARESVFHLDGMTHDLLNYNQAVLGYLELVLSEKAIPEESLQFIQSAIQQVNACSQLIEDIRRIALVGLFVDRSSLRSMGLREVVDESIEELELIFPQRGITVNVQDKIPGATITWTNILQDMLLSLLKNAVRSDKSEEVAIDMTIAGAEGPGGILEIIIDDRSSGIPGDLKSVKDTDASGTAKLRKLRGFGLILVRKAAKHFGGELLLADRVEGDHTKGARIILRIPEEMKL